MIKWVGNPFDTAADPSQAASSWMPPPHSTMSRDTEPPPNLPVIDFPPKVRTSNDGKSHEVPTRYGISYSVPFTPEWRPSNTRIMSWSDESGTKATLGSVSDYRYGHCNDGDDFALATIGVRGRNGVNTNTAAREQIDLFEQIFVEGSESHPRIERSSPQVIQYEDSQGSSHSVEISEISSTKKCHPSRVRITSIAVPAHATSEVAVVTLIDGTFNHETLSDQVAEFITHSITRSYQ
ncbi:hypothetical protein [Nocardia neocaledoniensis]|uniref:hypothetical protein n=1 Tax=Nocardia neocaledoniensis TaxID=236511 RepID=UPI002455D7C6|nr:hypothetical protein [Nocardia neocaledoniensis]